VAAGGVDDELGLFVEGDELVVFVDDVEGDVFGEGFVGGDLGEGDVEGVAGAELGGAFSGVAVDDNGAGLDEFLEHGAGVIGEAVAEIEIDALLEVVLDVELDFLEGSLLFGEGGGIDGGIGDGVGEGFGR
jgi:hypothetical protein